MGSIYPKPARALLAVGLVLPLLIGCSGDPSGPTGPSLDVTVKDFKIEPSVPTIEEGFVTLRVWNKGPATHEFVVVRSDLPADHLPIAADGLSVDEGQVVPVDEIAEVEAGTPGVLTLALTPGRYVLFCNLEGHYLGGMFASIEVTARV
jgi:uncharacterized cupredoxin-like copper-binding protein